MMFHDDHADFSKDNYNQDHNENQDEQLTSKNVVRFPDSCPWFEHMAWEPCFPDIFEMFLSFWVPGIPAKDLRSFRNNNLNERGCMWKPQSCEYSNMIFMQVEHG